MRRYVIVSLMVIAILLCFSACVGGISLEEVEETECQHDWSRATCAELSHCSKCGETSGNLAPHQFVGGSCTKARVCSVCGEKGSLDPHKYRGGDCQNPPICEVCGAEGELKDHDFQDGSCISPDICVVCGAEGELKDHNFSEATCTDPGVCSVCGETTPALGHDMEEATCTDPAFCIRCGYTDGEALGHEGKGICTRCGNEIPIAGSGYGDSVISDINLDDSFYVLHMTHAGRRNFIIHSYSADGDKDYLINEIGAYDGTVLLLSTPPVMLNIQADGNWTYEIRKLETTDETSFSGKSDYVTDIFSCASGAQVWHFKHNGDHNFIVHMYTTDGRDSIVNEIGAYDASQVITVPAGSKVFFEITADGDWEIYPEK